MDMDISICVLIPFYGSATGGRTAFATHLSGMQFRVVESFEFAGSFNVSEALQLKVPRFCVVLVVGRSG